MRQTKKNTRCQSLFWAKQERRGYRSVNEQSLLFQSYLHFLRRKMEIIRMRIMKLSHSEKTAKRFSRLSNFHSVSFFKHIFSIIKKSLAFSSTFEKVFFFPPLLCHSIHHFTDLFVLRWCVSEAEEAEEVEKSQSSLQKCTKKMPTQRMKNR